MAVPQWANLYFEKSNVSAHRNAAARSWLSRLPEGPAGQQGELTIAKIQAPYDPLSTLTFLTRSNTRDPPTRELWDTCMGRLVATDGDWQGWLARMPAGSERANFESLTAEARLLELARAK